MVIVAREAIYERCLSLFSIKILNNTGIKSNNFIESLLLLDKIDQKIYDQEENFAKVDDFIITNFEKCINSDYSPVYLYMNNLFKEPFFDIHKSVENPIRFLLTTENKLVYKLVTEFPDLDGSFYKKINEGGMFLIKNRNIWWYSNYFRNLNQTSDQINDVYDKIMAYRRAVMNELEFNQNNGNELNKLIDYTYRMIRENCQWEEPIEIMNSFLPKRFRTFSFKVELKFLDISQKAIVETCLRILSIIFCSKPNNYIVLKTFKDEKYGSKFLLHQTNDGRVSRVSFQGCLKFVLSKDLSFENSFYKTVRQDNINFFKEFQKPLVSSHQFTIDITNNIKKRFDIDTYAVILDLIEDIVDFTEASNYWIEITKTHLLDNVITIHLYLPKRIEKINDLDTVEFYKLNDDPIYYLDGNYIRIKIEDRMHFHLGELTKTMNESLLSKFVFILTTAICLLMNNLSYTYQRHDLVKYSMMITEVWYYILCSKVNYYNSIDQTTDYGKLFNLFMDFGKFFYDNLDEDKISPILMCKINNKHFNRFRGGMKTLFELHSLFIPIDLHTCYKNLKITKIHTRVKEFEIYRLNNLSLDTMREMNKSHTILLCYLEETFKNKEIGEMRGSFDFRKDFLIPDINNACMIKYEEK